jgi:hypothetical protein
MNRLAFKVGGRVVAKAVPPGMDRVWESNARET